MTQTDWQTPVVPLNARIQIDPNNETLGWVALVDMLPHPDTNVPGDLAIINAARTSVLGASKGKEADVKLLRYLMQHRHTSPFEMVEFKFDIVAPLMVWIHMIRHRTASLNMSSGRYLEMSENDVYIPSEWRLQSPSNKQASYGQLDADGHRAFVDGIKRDGDILYDDYIMDGWVNMTQAFEEHVRNGFAAYKQALAAGVAKEQARLWLPAYCLHFRAQWKIDAHNLMHFIGLRTHDGAQWETRQLAHRIKEIFALALPETAKLYDEFRSS